MVDGLKVLVVDDEPVVAESLAVQLAGDGWQVLVAHDGQAALSLVETHRPICALIDLKMPGMDGTELAQHLRARWKDDIVLIAITGWGGEHVAMRDEVVLMDHVLRKPIDIAEVRRVLRP